jgi:catechol 2,3-dioxygenase-like lactoylglutathione lyase family enzyme
MSVRLEHANLRVIDIDAMLEFLKVALPEFRIRHDATGSSGRRWVHVGTDETYIALGEASKAGELPEGAPGLAHLGCEVTDVDAVRRRLLAAGYRESEPPVVHPFRKRIYFLDPEDREWEFVQYTSDDPRERNDYELPDG